MLKQIKSTPVTKKIWGILILFGLIGQIAWSVENMYFNLFVYETIAPRTSAVTVMVQASGIVATVVTLLAGALSDKLGNRRHFISIGYIVWGLVTLSFAFISKENTTRLFGIVDAEQVIAVTTFLVVFMDCVMTFFGAASNDAAFNAWITDNTDKTNRGRVEGKLAALPLLALLIVSGGFGFIKDAFGYPVLFLGLGVTVTVIGVAGLFLIKDAAFLQRNREGSYFKDIFYGFRPGIIRNNRILYLVLVAFGIFSISIQVYMPYLIILMNKYLGFTTLEYSALLAGLILAAIAVAMVLGTLSDKIGKAKLLMIGLAVYIVGLVALSFLSAGMEKSTLITLMALFGLFMLAGNVLLGVLFAATIRNYTPPKEAGKFQGIRMIFAVLLPMFIGPAIGDSINQIAATKDPNIYTYIDETTGLVANLPTETLFIAAAVVAALTLVPLLFVIKKIDTALY